jgi:hypothetical protein
VDGEVNPGSPDIEASDMLIEVESLQLDYLTDDNTVLIHGGWLRFRGALKQLMLVLHRSFTTSSYEDWIMVVNGLHDSVFIGSAMGHPQPHVKLDAFHENFDK